MDCNNQTSVNIPPQASPNIEAKRIDDENAMRDELLTFLAMTSSTTSDEPFFHKLARYLAQCLEMDFVCIDRLDGDGLTATTVAVWSEGHFEDNVSYSLKDTPCGDVVGQTVCCFPARVTQMFPNDQVLKDLKAESYVGATLWSHTGKPIGLIAVISRHPLNNRPLAESIMQIVAMRAAGEIERLDAEKALLESEKKYRQMFEHQPNGYALHEIIVDQNGIPCDYRFLEINPAFETLTGLKATDLIGRTQLEVMPNSEAFWAQTYGKVALTGDPISFENYSRELNRYYHVNAYSPEPGKFVTVFHDITDRKQTEDALKENRSLLNNIVNGTSDAIYAKDLEGRYLLFNEAAEGIVGKKAEEVLGKDDTFIFSETEALAIMEGDRKVIEGGLVKTYEEVVTDASGQTLTFLSTKGPLFNANDNVIGIFGIARDITRLITANEVVKKSEVKFAKAFNACPALIAITSMEDGRYIEVNDNFLTYTGYLKDEVIGHTSLELGVWLDQNERQSYINDLITNGSIRNKEYKFRMRNGDVRDFVVSSELIEIDEKRCNLNFIVDITERKHIEYELRNSTEDLKESQQIAHVGTWRLDLASNQVKWSEELYRMYGFDPELPPPPYTEHQKLFTAESWGKLSSALQSTLHSGIPYDLELETVRDDGSSGWMWVYGMPVLDEHGVTVGLRGMAQDISERKEKEKALRDSETKYRMLVDNLSAGVVVHAADSSIIFSNPMASTLLGLSNEQMLGKAVIDPAWCFMQENGSPLPLEGYPVNQVLNTGKPLSGFTLGVCRHDLSEPLWVLCNAYPIENSEGLLQQVVVVFSDITNLKKAEEAKLSYEQQIQQAQKMESLGVLAGGIAHDFNNILTSIVGNTELALMRLKPESPVLENLQRIEKGAIRATDLAKQMLAYSGKGKFVVDSIDLNRLVEEMGHMLDVSISKKVVLRYNLTKPLPAIEADATQIRQVVMNLVINASEAIGDKSGVIAITSGCIQCDRNYLRSAYLNHDIPEGLYVYLEVADTGCGMDKETKAKLFEPFFTTKFTGRGLGMAAVQGIIRGHKGAINVYSEVGKGSTFKLLFPAGARPAEQFDQEPAEIKFKGEGTILLVDDEETVRAIGTEMLKELGFSVITANDGKEAIDLYQSHQGLHCVILDLTMPHKDGEQTFRELRISDPSVKVIMSSGYSEYEVTQKFAGKGLSGFIQKPFKMSTLQEVLQRI